MSSDNSGIIEESIFPSTSSTETLSTLYSPCAETTHFTTDVNDPPGTISGESIGCLANGMYTPHNVHIQGQAAFVSWYSDGLVKIDLSDPKNPVVTSQLRIGCPLDDNSTAPPDVWGVYKSSGVGSAVGYSDRSCGYGVAQEKGSNIWN